MIDNNFHREVIIFFADHSMDKWSLTA